MKGHGERNWPVIGLTQGGEFRPVEWVTVYSDLACLLVRDDVVNLVRLRVAVVPWSPPSRDGKLSIIRAWLGIFVK
eukprot:4229955-Amphidinium_carterae.1